MTSSHLEWHILYRCKERQEPSAVQPTAQVPGPFQILHYFPVTMLALHTLLGKCAAAVRIKPLTLAPAKERNQVQMNGAPE